MNPIPWSEFTRQIDELYAPPMRAPRTRTKMLHTLAALEALGAETTADLSAAMVARYIASRPELAARTMHSHLLYIQAAANLAESLGLLSVNPFKVRPMRRWIRLGRPAPQAHQSRAEIRAVLDQMRSDIQAKEGWSQWRARRLFALTSLMAYCGLRRDEGLYATVGQVDLEGRVFWVRPRVGGRLKTEASDAPVPMPCALVEVLGDWLTHRLDAPPGSEVPECEWLFPTCCRKAPWTSGEHGKRPLERLQAVAKRAGVDHITWKSLRRNLATHLELHGAGQATITRILRHTESATTRDWYQMADLKNLTAAVEGFEY